AALLSGCALTSSPHPASRVESPVMASERAVVVGLERDLANQQTVEDLSRAFAFGLTRRGRVTVPLSDLVEAAQTAGRPLPDAVQARLRGGLVDVDTASWLRAGRVPHGIFPEVGLYDEIWEPDGKRTRVGLLARGRDLAQPGSAWIAHSTPEVVDEHGRGFQLGTEVALASLLRKINGESEPVRLPRISVPYVP